jgi:magnesium chelatase subunit D
VRKQLAQLPGGGGTPLASGIAMASELAESIARRGDTPILVFFTDGQANVTREGIGNRAQAEEDASAMAKHVRARSIASLLVDTSPRPQPRARKLAEDLGARYLPLPAADAQRVSKALKAEIAAR